MFFCHSASQLPRGYLILLNSLLLLLISSGLTFAAPIKVGVYDNKPLVYQAEQGDYQGFTIDVLRHIAEQENWTLQFVPGTWTECLQRLEAGEIDLQVAISASDTRKRLFSFPEKMLTTSWGRLYQHPGSDHESLLDLNGKQIALLEKGIHATAFLNLMAKFDQQVEPIFVQSYDQVLEQVENGSAAAGIVNRIYAIQNAHRYRVETTPILFNPTEVSYAAPKGKNAQLLQALDRHIQALRQDKNSIYFKSLEKWFGNEQVTKIPTWIIAAFSISGTLLLLILFVSMLLKRQVSLKTSELLHVNQQLTEQIEQLQTAKNLLHESEQKYRTVLAISAEGFWMIGPDFTTVETNDSLCKMLGYSPEEIIGKVPFAFVDEENRKILSRELDRATENDQCRFEVVLSRKDGTELPVIINSTSLRNAAGELQGAFAFITDISERKQAELALQLSNERFMTVLNSIGAGIYVADMESDEILFMNRFLIDEFGRNFTGQSYREMLRNETGSCEHFTSRQLLDDSGQPGEVLTWQGVNPLNGKHYMNHDRAIRWDDDRIVRLQISTDISGIKTLETQLRQKYKMEAVGLMAGGIAHDFNNILAIIITNLELMHRKMADDNPLRQRLEQAKSASQRASNLVKQILTYSRQGEQDLKPVQPAFIVEEALKLLRSTTPTSIDILIQIDVAAKSENVLADSTQIEEVLINLCTNAIHAMGEKGLLTVALQKARLTTESLSGQAEIQAGDYLKLTVNDTGIGMSQEIKEKIFDPFFTTKPAGQGTGMGLSISHGIIKKHNGYFTVDSQPDQGSSFSIYLPIVAAGHATAGEEINDALPRGNERILLIDDEELLAVSVADFLTEQGYSVEIETDSPQALKRFTTYAEPFDLVLTDQTMPELTGMELAAELIKSDPQIPIILGTGYSATMTKESALEAGIKAVLMKPLDLPDLTRTIRTILDQKAS